MQKHHLEIHGQRKKHHTSPAYRSWLAMKKRCTDKTHQNYHNYGGRGITICSRWLNSFIAFYDDMGDRPDGTTIDRIDPDGNYEPGNCRWATTRQQASNKRNGIHIVFDGESITLSELGVRFGIPQTTIYRRYKQGYRDEQLISNEHKLKLRTGENANNNKLTWDTVEEIRQQYAKGVTQASLANTYNVTQSVISQIVNNKAWVIK